MTNEKTTRELVYETNRDVKWICRTLRRMEAQEKQSLGAISQLLRQHRVVGFSTYGEQLNSMHVNQTMTGVAIYPPASHD